jgi:hypothetical protein
MNLVDLFRRPSMTIDRTYPIFDSTMVSCSRISCTGMTTHMRICTRYRITTRHAILWLQYGLHLWQQSWQAAVLALEKGKDLRSVHLQLIKLRLWGLLQQIGIWRTKPPTEDFDTLPLRSRIYNIGIRIYRLQKIDTMLLPTMHANLSSKDY